MFKNSKYINREVQVSLSYNREVQAGALTVLHILTYSVVMVTI